MSDDRAARAERRAKALAALRGRLATFPPSVLNGGITRAAAWKRIAVKAHRAIGRDAKTEDLEALTLKLNTIANAPDRDVGNLAAMK